MASPFSFLKKFGLFSPGTVKNGGKISHPGMKNLYEELKKIGFRETRWQIISKEQLAGLVLPLTDGENELHIRFYRDRVFAECEAARIYISHLFKKAINANSFFWVSLKNLYFKLFFELFNNANKSIGMIDIKREEREEIRGLALDNLRYMTLAEIEERLLVIEYEKPRRIYKVKENFNWDDEIEASEIAYLDVEKAQLERKRQFILDRRNDWKAKGIWNIIVPIVVSVITAYLVSVFVMKLGGKISESIQ